MNQRDLGGGGRFRTRPPSSVAPSTIRPSRTELKADANNASTRYTRSACAAISGRLGRSSARLRERVRECPLSPRLSTDAGSVRPPLAHRASRGMVWVEVRPCRRVRTRSPIAFAGRIGGLCGFWSAWWRPPASASASSERSLRVRRDCRGRRSRVWSRGSTPAAAPSSSRRTGRSRRRRTRSGSTSSSCLRSRNRPERMRSRTSPADLEDAATEGAARPGDRASWLTLNTYRDILLVDQRDTGRSSPHGGDVTQYGTRMAMDDLDAVRAALGYRQLDVIGSPTAPPRRRST